MENNDKNIEDRNENKRRSFYAFIKNKGAVVGTIVFSILIICSLFAPLIAPYDPYTIVRDSLESPILQHIMALHKLCVIF